MTAPLEMVDGVLRMPIREPDKKAHMVDQKKWNLSQAVIEGFEVEALCGHRFIPYNTPDGREVCIPCLEEYGRIVDART